MLTEGVEVKLEVYRPSIDVDIQSLELTPFCRKHISVGAGGRGGVLLIPLDTVIPVAIHPTIAIPLIQLKMAPYNFIVNVLHFHAINNLLIYDVDIFLKENVYF